MKRIAIIAILLLSAGLSKAQDLAPDQNPRYQESMNQYMQIADSLTRTQGTTPQNTYKAYDFYQHRQEIREQRRQRRQAAWMYGGYGSYNWPGSMYSPWGFNSFWMPGRRHSWGLGLNYGRWW